NWDTFTGTVRFVNAEVPSAIGGPYQNPVPASTTLPASFYYTTVPTWWPSGKPWPLIGPDVTGGNMSGTGGHANTNPAMDCYTNVMHGPADGTGPVLTFDPATCYATTGAVPFAPTGLTATSGVSTVSLTWTAPTTPPPVQTYNVYRGTVHNGPYTLIKS